ncbi:ubiquinol-cytochrome c reductase cytochrome b subunit [Actinospica sp. MGRD01-02]|uniref:Cytochrome bc1 complex cytochrome b subunit n=1 Tax=Actinospica acidithermotolerans TaxID=2828514 RepID=A0A941E7J0_9ACTN|nr:ubiquinol-cytochrome c reductase cytochrome b subunit [Actinospica acidithermotolerans]MBR7826521.1 ubiquinol-cytochrome c reductase cytochrome b subunit [Actinospica acidithermotolerans]
MSTSTSNEEIVPTTLGGKASDYLDQRLGIAGAAKKNLRKIFPDHWSFMLGEVCLYSFIILLLSGIFLTLFFTPSMGEVTYNGSYTPLDGIKMSEAYASTLNISFDVRGGLLMRQIHHWAALVFVMGIMVHMLRIFFTGAFRKPRELNWLIGFTLFVLALLEGFAGYSLPDDLLSGTGLRIMQGIILSIPIVGTYLSYFFFGGLFPGHVLIPRLFTVHILLVPGIILALITAHLILVFYQKHTQWAGPGRTNENVVGLPLMPVYMAKAGGFFFVVFGFIALLGGLVSINPIWDYGPYVPTQITAGSQPDFYIGFFEGALRMMPNWEINAWGHTLSLNILIPAVVVPGILFTGLAIYPFFEAWVTGDKREHHILDRPRNMPTRTAIGVAGIVFYGIGWINGGNDLVATHFNLSVETITWVDRVLIFVGPVFGFWLTRRICFGLQRRDRDKVLHGRESGIITRSPEGQFSEIHTPLPQGDLHKLTAHDVHRPLTLTEVTDSNGVPAPKLRLAKLRARATRWYFGERVEKPTEEEYRQAISSGHH